MVSQATMSPLMLSVLVVELVAVEEVVVDLTCFGASVSFFATVASPLFATDLPFCRYVVTSKNTHNVTRKIIFRKLACMMEI
jgi:hypothetical protein